jgi:hypothetical protein
VEQSLAYLTKAVELNPRSAPRLTHIPQQFSTVVAEPGMNNAG